MGTSSWLAWLIAIICAAAFLILWFRDVRRIMRERRSTLEYAAGQMRSWREKAIKAEDDPHVAAVFRRSETIYQQAVDHYNDTLARPWIRLPAALMGFRPLKDREGGGGC